MPIATIEELREALKDNPQVDEILTFIDTAIETEKSTGITGRRKANQEAQGLRKFKQALEDAGFDGDSEGVTDWLESLRAPAPGDPAKPGEPNPEIDKLRREFAKAQRDLESARTEASKVKAMADKRAIKSKLNDALRDKVYGPDLLADSLIGEGRVKLTEDEEVVFVHGEDEFDFNSGLKKLLESRPDLLRNTQAPGARSTTRPNQAAPRYTTDQLKNMTANEIAADMSNVLESMKSMKT